MKPSPVASILLFVGALLLLVAAFSASWFTMGDGDSSMSVGLIRFQSCFDGDCKSATVFRGGVGSLGFYGMVAVLEFVLCLAGAGLAATTGFLLLKPGRHAMSIVTLSVVGVAGLFGLIVLAQKPGGASFGYAFAMFWLGAAGAIAASIIAMTRPRGATPAVGMPLRPMGPPLGMPYPPYPQQAALQHRGMPCRACQTPTVWVAQYNRWFCQRCNQYP